MARLAQRLFRPTTASLILVILFAPVLPVASASASSSCCPEAPPREVVPLNGCQFLTALPCCDADALPTALVQELPAPPLAIFALEPVTCPALAASTCAPAHCAVGPPDPVLLRTRALRL